MTRARISWISTAVVMLVLGVGIVIAAGPQQKPSSPATAETLMGAALHQEEVEGNLEAAIATYKKVIADARVSRSLKATALMHLGQCYEKLGDAEARKAYERVVREFADQAESAALASRRLAALQSPASAQSSQATRQIWTRVPTPFYGSSPSADGRYLSFTDWDTGDVAVHDLSNDTNRRLTNKGGWTSGDFADASVVSPDGRQIAYAWFDDKTRRYDLRILPLSGGQAGSPKIVHRSDETSYIAPYAWTPDGRLVVVRTLGDRTNQIATISMTDGSVRVLKSLEWRWPSSVSLSPDGRYVAYDVPAGDEAPARGDIFVLAVDGSRETVAVQNPADDHSPLWSPDGSQIVFLSDRTGSLSLWTVHLDAGKPNGPPELVKRDIGQFSPLGMTRGGALYYRSGGDRKNVYIAELDGQMKAIDKPVLATERFIDSNGNPAWSPDGQYLAYLSERRGVTASPGSVVLVIRSLKTGEDRDVLMRLVALPRPVRWFPDSRSVLVASRDMQRGRFGFGYYRVDIASGNAELLHSTKRIVRNANLPDLSLDGKSIFYADRDVGSETEQLMRFDIDSRRETVLKRLPDAQICSLAVSPDGAQLAYLVTNEPTAQGPTSLEVMPAVGGEARTVFRVKTWGGGASRFSSLGWTPDGRHLVFVRPENGESNAQVPRLWRIPVGGGAPEDVGISLNRPVHPRVHPDGHRIAFELDEPGTSEVWALENFLPKARATR